MKGSRGTICAALASASRLGPLLPDCTLQFCCNEDEGRIGLHQDLEAFVLFRGPFVTGVVRHRNKSSLEFSQIMIDGHEHSDNQSGTQRAGPNRI
jgi:hypothetical protein